MGVPSKPSTRDTEIRLEHSPSDFRARAHVTSRNLDRPVGSGSLAHFLRALASSEEKRKYEQREREENGNVQTRPLATTADVRMRLLPYRGPIGDAHWGRVQIFNLKISRRARTFSLPCFLETFRAVYTLASLRIENRNNVETLESFSY